MKISRQFIAEKLGMPIETVDKELDLFKEMHDEETFHKIPPETLEDVCLRFYFQFKRDVALSHDASPAKPIKMFVLGVTKLKDNIAYRRNQIIKEYNESPNKAVGSGSVDEYTVNNDVISKRYYNDKKKDIDTITVDSLPKLSINTDDENIFLVLKDIIRTAFGKPNPSYGKPLPLHQYKRVVFGIAEIDNNGKKDCNFGKIFLKDGNAVTVDLPTPGKTYQVRVNKKKDNIDNIFTFYDSPKYTYWNEIDWNPYGDEDFFSNILKEEFMEPMKKDLIDLKKIAQDENLEKGQNALKSKQGGQKSYDFIKYDSCFFVPVDIVQFVLYPDGSDKISRMTVDFEDDFIEDSDKIVGWISDKALDGCVNGERSRAILCCYPKWNVSRNPQIPDSYSLEVYGILPENEIHTNFNKEKYIKIEDLEEEEE